MAETDPRSLDITFSPTAVNKLKLVIRAIAKRMAEEDYAQYQEVQNNPREMRNLFGQPITEQEINARLTSLRACLRGDTGIYSDIVFDVASGYISDAKQFLFDKIKPIR